MANYLDETGLNLYDEKIKGYVKGKVADRVAKSDVTSEIVVNPTKVAEASFSASEITFTNSSDNAVSVVAVDADASNDSFCYFGVYNSNGTLVDGTNASSATTGNELFSVLDDKFVEGKRSAALTVPAGGSAKAFASSSIVSIYTYSYDEDAIPDSKAVVDYVSEQLSNVAADIPSAATANPLMDGTAAVGTSSKYAKEDHVHPKDTTKANIASPTFTGTPKAPTAAAGTNTTQIATTAFVQDAVDDLVPDYSKNLAGFTEQQATFAYRPTAGSLDVAEQANSDQALIKGVLGRTVAWNQLYKIIPGSNTLNGVSFTATEDGKLVVNGTCTASVNNFARFSKVNIVSGHHYFLKEYGPAWPISSHSSYVASLQIYMANIINLAKFENEESGIGALAVATGSGVADVRFRIQSGVTYNLSVWGALIDLTLIYGEGNEPTTAAQFEADYESWFGKPLTYEAYTAGELRNLTMAGIKTQGFNLLGSGTMPITWNQLVQNGDFSDGTTVWTPRTAGNIQVNNSQLELIKKVNNYNNSVAQTFVNPLPAGHKYYAKIDVVSIYNGFLLGLYGTYQSGGIYFRSSIAASGQYSSIITAGQNLLRISITPNNRTVPPNIDDKLCTIDNVMLIDLTLIYGEGNEPTTAAQFEADYKSWFGKELTYEAYNEGTEKNVPVGKSMVLANTAYQLSGDFTTIRDSQGTAITPDAQGLFTPTESTEVTVSGVGSDTCLHFVHSGRRNGEYEEHWEETKEIDVTQIKGKLDGTGSSVLLAPNGLLQAGDVHDEIYLQDGKRWFAKRVGRVDLGTLGWTYNSQFIRFVATLNVKRVSSGNVRGNLATPIFSNIPINTLLTSTSKDKVIAVATSQAISARDLAYTDSDAFKTSLSGVYLNYELATPEYYLLDDEWQDDGAWSYKVDDWGTEQVVSPAGGQSAPLPCTIQYGINALDTLRNLPTNYVATSTQSLTEVQKKTARENIGAVSSTDGYFVSYIGYKNQALIQAAYEDPDEDPVETTVVTASQLSADMGVGSLAQRVTALENASASNTVVFTTAELNTGLTITDATQVAKIAALVAAHKWWNFVVIREGGGDAYTPNQEFCMSRADVLQNSNQTEIQMYYASEIEIDQYTMWTPFIHMVITSGQIEVDASQE